LAAVMHAGTILVRLVLPLVLIVTADEFAQLVFPPSAKPSSRPSRDLQRLEDRSH
jgi:hypothetical protein